MCACSVCVLVCACVYVHVGANAHTSEQQLWNEPLVSARVDLGSHVGLARRHVQHLGIYSLRILRFALPAPGHRAQHAPSPHISSTTKTRYSDNCMRESGAHRPQHAPAHHVAILCYALVQLRSACFLTLLSTCPRKLEVSVLLLGWKQEPDTCEFT